MDDLHNCIVLFLALQNDRSAMSLSAGYQETVRCFFGISRSVRRTHYYRLQYVRFQQSQLFSLSLLPRLHFIRLLIRLIFFVSLTGIYLTLYLNREPVESHAALVLKEARH